MCAYKNYDGKASERPMILCPCPAPKRLLTSTNWVSRNDSSNVNAILHPENYLVSPRLKYGEKTKGDVIEKHILGRNTCYCRCKNKKIPKPTFFKRPNTCVSYERTPKTTCTAYEEDLKRESLLGCVCNDSDDDLNAPEHLKSRLSRLKLSKSAPEQMGMKYSDQRQLYGEYREMQKENFEEEVQRYRDHERKLLVSGHEAGEGDSEDINTILGTQKLGTGSSTSKYGGTTTTISGQDVFDYSDNYYGSSDEFPKYSEQDVPDFRREHYFETHNIGKVAKITDTGDVSKDHICVHQFKLDKRWLPEPVSKDTFGRSLCKMCDKPMGASTLNLSSGYLFSEDGLSRSKLKNYAEAYQSGLMPKSINLSRGKSKIELVIKESDIAGFYNYINKDKRPVYCNSLALRQQKMSLI